MSRGGFASCGHENVRPRETRVTCVCRECRMRIATIGLVVFTFIGTMLAWLGTATAQPCVSDNECTRGLGLRANSRCLGNTLVKKRTRCVAGRCQTREVSRSNCASNERGRCVAGAFEYKRGRCDGMSARCATRTERTECRKSCVCNKGVMRVWTGKCSSSIGCHKAVLKCLGKCECDPEPVCQ